MAHFSGSESMLKSIISTLQIIGSMTYFKLTYKPALEIFTHYTEIITGEYTVAETDPLVTKTFIVFCIWCMCAATIFTPRGDIGSLEDDE